MLGFKYNNKIYYYQKNYQNDITGIYDSNYSLVVTYKYDAYGNILSVQDNTTNNIGRINPFRYRSYYYDEETSLYYLNSRYYNPKWCRFISIDEYSGQIEDPMSHNMYSYSFNNPINYNDDNGLWPKWAKNAIKIGVGLAAIGIGVAVTVYSGGLAGPAVVAGLKTAVVIGGISAGVAATVSVTKSLTQKKNTKEIVKDASSSAIDGFAEGFMVGGISAGIGLSSTIGSTEGLKMGSTANPKYGRITVGYGTNNGKTLACISNSNGKSLFRVDADPVHFIHMHFRDAHHGIGYHRKELTEIIFGLVSGIAEGARD